VSEVLVTVWDCVVANAVYDHFFLVHCV
jgi:hypothetical protein